MSQAEKACPSCGEVSGANETSCLHCQADLEQIAPDRESKGSESQTEIASEISGTYDVHQLQSLTHRQHEEPLEQPAADAPLWRHLTKSPHPSAEMPLPSADRVRLNQELIRERRRAIFQKLEKESLVEKMMRGDYIERLATEVRTRIRHAVDSDPAPLSVMDKSVLFQQLLDEVFGFGPLGPLLRDPTVGDIFVNKYNDIYVERLGALEKSDATFDNDGHLRVTIDKIILPLGQHLDKSSPVVHSRLPNGSRVTATIPPISIDGPTLTIRVFSFAYFTLEQMAENGSLSKPMAEFLTACVKGSINMIVCGPVSSGKSSMLSVLSAHINPRERLITIENAPELRPFQEHWVRLETRPPDAEGKGQITARSLISTSLGMRANRIVLGDCEGDEVFDLLHAMSTSVPGSMAAMIAKSPSDCVDCLERMVLMSREHISTSSARRLIADSVQVIVQLVRLPDGSRRVSEIAEITGMEGDKVGINTLFYLERKESDDGSIQCRYQFSGLSAKTAERLAKAGVQFSFDSLAAEFS